MKNILLKVKHKEDGVTLVELLAAIAILSIIVTSFLAFFIQSANTNKMTNEVNEATFIAQGIMEEITHHSSAGLSIKETESIIELRKSEFLFDYKIVKDTNSSLYKVIVTVPGEVNKRAQIESRLPFTIKEGEVQDAE